MIENGEKGISITNLAERHLRRSLFRLNLDHVKGISITNLAERHLRPSPESPSPPTVTKAYQSRI